MSTRIPQLTDAQAEAQCPPELLDAIRRRRGGQLLELDRLLLHSAPLAEGWNALMGRVRSALALPTLWRELGMCGVAALNGADYEMHHHLPLYRAAGGSAAQATAIERLATDPEAALADPAWDADPAQRALLRMTLEMTRGVRVAEPTFSAARAALGDDRAVMEFVAVVAAYNMVSRILVALELAP